MDELVFQNCVKCGKTFYGVPSGIYRKCRNKLKHKDLEINEMEKIKYTCVKCGEEAVVGRIPVDIQIDAILYNKILDIIDSENSLYTGISDFVNSAIRKEIHLNIGI